MKCKDRVPMQDGDEVDFIDWKHVFSLKSGEARRVKRKYRRRCRKKAKEELQMSYDMVIDPATPGGDMSCIVYFTVNKAGGIDIVDLAHFDAQQD